MPTPLQPGLLILHGNRLEQLAEAVFSHVARHPLGPLEEEVFVVQSNGMAEWLKMEIATAHGVCAATRVELPARFMWRAYRAALGAAAVPAVQAMDKLPLTWRFMKLLPRLADQPGFEPVAGFIEGGDPLRRLQLAQRLADLYDQYQVYRSDWLQDWAEGADVLRTPTGQAPVPVPPPQRWQPALWRAALHDWALSDEASGHVSTTRALLHQRFLQAVTQPPEAQAMRLPRRVVLFGTTHIPLQTLEALAALATRCQVLIAAPNPSRYHWADIIDGRELLSAAQHRHATRGALDLAAVPLHEMHAHGHPLLAAWGRQGRDFVRQLDAFDDVQRARRQFDVPRVDLFDDGEGGTLLSQVQARIRDLVPLAEHPQVDVPDDDRSIVFHSAHSAQREVEILHDQLLDLLGRSWPDGKRPSPRDIVVMVPDIDAFAPAIRSVFGQHARGSARHIPWGIADQKNRGRHALLVAVEWLLRAPQQRFGISDVRGLLDVPGLARRFQLAASDLPVLAAWMTGAGVRWGLDLAQRDSLGLADCGERNTWAFGLHRMLMGYASGDLNGIDGHAGIEPYPEVAGLSAGLAGTLADLLAALQAWWHEAQISRTPADWAGRLRALLATFFDASDDTERALLTALGDALAAWLQACEAADCDEPLSVDVVREAWLEAVDEPGLSQRFKAGGVTFCTLLPMRAIPFDVVCLLGMNDGDYPRRSPRSDFDLMALPGQARPGDRSRRNDDRQLMLDALLSARRVLYVSWAGRSQRDNAEQAPSVLVGQLRDYLAAGWGAKVVKARTTEHPLQPFSRRYFQQRSGADARLVTYAAEWRTAHDQVMPVTAAAAAAATIAVAPASPSRMTFESLASLLRNPVRAYFRHRLQVSFDELGGPPDDDEPFESAGLEGWAVADTLLQDLRRQLDSPLESQAMADRVQAQVARVARAGRLPVAGPGQRVETELAARLQRMLAQWQMQRAQRPVPCEKRQLRFVHPQHPNLQFEDWLEGLRAPTGSGCADAVWLDVTASRVLQPKSTQPKPDKLLRAWVRCLVSAACGQPARGVLIAADALVQVSPPDAAVAAEALATLMLACDEGLRGDAPMPTAIRTGIALLSGGKPANVYDGTFDGPPGEVRDACLARLFPTYAALSSHPDFEPATQRLYAACTHWLANHVTVEPLLEAADAQADDD